MSVVKNQCGLGFQSDVIDFFFKVWWVYCTCTCMYVCSWNEEVTLRIIDCMTS